MMVVQQQVMVFAEKHAVRHVCAAGVSRPVLDVVRFAPGGWSFATRPQASAVPLGQSDALSWGEESVFAADIEWLSVRVEGHGEGSLGAGESFDGLDGHGDLAALHTAVSGSTGQGV
ncbi:MAG: hypothetical protein M3O28_02975, partial [Actinomycetota bacterium]|nr:hypothetical protein [Actinomycetota bacterium]